MNNKGWGLASMLSICGVFVACLMIITFTVNNDFRNNSSTVKTQSSSLKTKDNNTQVLEVEENNTVYEEMEQKLVLASKQYIRKHSLEEGESLIVSLTKLQKENYIQKMNDPNHSKNECLGYVVYTKKDESYRAYLRCPSSYRTIDYQNNFE